MAELGLVVLLVGVPVVLGLATLVMGKRLEQEEREKYQGCCHECCGCHGCVEECHCCECECKVHCNCGCECECHKEAQCTCVKCECCECVGECNCGCECECHKH